MPDQYRTCIIMNPASASGQTPQKWPVLEGLLGEHGFRYDLRTTAGPGDATRLAREAIHDGYEMVVALGGDGTVNEVVNGFYEQGRAINPDAVLGILCVGTGGDFVKSMGIPKEPQQAVERLLGQRTTTTDLGRVEFFDGDGQTRSRYFANIADIGVGGETVERINRKATKATGRVAYFWHTLVSMLKYENKRLRIQVDDDYDEEQVFSLLVVANGRFFGGGMKIAPEAKTDDGLFDVVTVGDIGTTTFLANLGRLYKDGLLDHPQVNLIRGRRVTIETSDRALLDVDGEQPGQAPAVFEMMPGAVRIKV